MKSIGSKFFNRYKVKNHRVKSRKSDDVINYRAALYVESLNLEFSVVRKTVSAINRPPFGWFEWDFGLNTTVRTGNLVHFPGAATAASETTTAITASGHPGKNFLCH